MQPRLVIACGREQVHESTRRIAVARIVKRDVEIGCRAEQMQQRPEREAVTAIGRETEVDLDPLNAGVSRVLRHLGQIACTEIAEEEIVEVHREKLADTQSRGNAMAFPELSSQGP